MRIVRADLRVLELRLKFRFRTSFGFVDTKPTILVELHDESGQVGIGEAPVFREPWYTSEYVAAALDVLERHLVPAVINRAADSAAELAGGMRRYVGHPAAKSAIEGACWHLQAQLEDRPLAALWRGSRGSVAAGISLGIEDHIETLLERVDRALDQGYKRVKLKIMPGRDVKMVQAVRARFPQAPLSVDANGAYEEVGDGVWDELDDLSLMMIEQPLAPERLQDHARLQARLRTPICLDESISSVARAREAVALDACRVMCVKPSHLAGFAASLEVGALCEEAGLSSWVGGMLESGIGKAYALHLAAGSGFDLPADISATDRYFEEDVLAEPMRIRDGSIKVPSEAGLGWPIHREVVEALSVEVRTLTSSGNVNRLR